MKPYFGFTGSTLNAWIAVACTAAMTLFGYDQGIFGGIIVTPIFLAQMGNPDANLQGTITSIYNIGCFVGSLAAITIGEKFGRRKTILLGMVVMIAGAIIQFLSYGVPQMIVGRIVTGIGNGFITASAPVWQSETIKHELRGKAIVLQGVSNVAGFCLSNWMTYGFSFLSGPVVWRFPLAFQVIFGIILLLTVPWLPESPRWLLAHGYEQRASEVLAALRGDGMTAEHLEIETVKTDILNSLALERESRAPWHEVLRGKSRGNAVVRRMILGMGTLAMQQLTGINVTSYYLPLVLQQSVGLSNRTSRLLAACNSVSYLICTLFGIPYVERWGRRKLIIYASAGQAVCYIIVTILLSVGTYATSAASVAFFFLYYVFFGAGFQGVPWLYPTELNSLQMRTTGAALGSATNWIVNYMVVQITPIGIDNIQWRFYIIWACFNTAFIPIIYCFYPETAGRTLEDIDRLFRDNKSIFVCRDKKAISTGRPLEYIRAEQEALERKEKGSSVTESDAGKKGEA